MSSPTTSIQPTQSVDGSTISAPRHRQSPSTENELEASRQTIVNSQSSESKSEPTRQAANERLLYIFDTGKDVSQLYPKDLWAARPTVIQLQHHLSFAGDRDPFLHELGQIYGLSPGESRKVLQTRLSNFSSHLKSNAIFNFQRQVCEQLEVSPEGYQSIRAGIVPTDHQNALEWWSVLTDVHRFHQAMEDVYTPWSQNPMRECFSLEADKEDLECVSKKYQQRARDDGIWLPETQAERSKRTIVETWIDGVDEAGDLRDPEPNPKVLWESPSECWTLTRWVPPVYPDQTSRDSSLKNKEDRE